MKSPPPPRTLWMSSAVRTRRVFTGGVGFELVFFMAVSLLNRGVLSSQRQRRPVPVVIGGDETFVGAFDGILAP
jgi:hypothetical protein